jgi:hypothetical protein
MQRRLTAALAAFALMLALLGAAQADEVIIGEQYPLSGPMAAFSGPFLKQGAEMAVDRINKEQMFGPGRTLRLIIEDNAGDRNQAISLMSKLGNTPGVMAIHGVYGSFLSLPAAPVANDLKIPYLATAVSTQIAAAGPWSFTQLPPALVSMSTIGEFAINRHHIKKVAAIFDRSNDASVQLKDAFLKYVSERGRIRFADKDRTRCAQPLSARSDSLVRRRFAAEDFDHLGLKHDAAASTVEILGGTLEYLDVPADAAQQITRERSDRSALARLNERVQNGPSNKSP